MTGRGVYGAMYTVAYRMRQIAVYFGPPSTWVLFHRAAQHYQTSVLAIAWRTFRLYWLDRYSPDEVLERGLANPRWSLDRYREHLCDAWLHGHQAMVNSPHSAACRDKLLFHSHCRAHDLPAPALHAVISAYACRTGIPNCELLASDADLDAFARHCLPDRFIVKPRMGNKGRDIQLVACAGEPEERQEYRANWMTGLIRGLEPNGDDWLIEEALVAHPDIARLTGSNAVSGVRIFTFVEDGQTHVVDGYLRLVVGGAVTDNISATGAASRSGNIVAPLDVRSGRVLDAYCFNGGGIDVQRFTSHPDTGVPVLDFTIPCWDMVGDLLDRACRAFVPIVTIGWDIAITRDGPVLIEANEQYQHSGMGSGVERVRGYLERLTANRFNVVHR